jgi:F420-dependent oxidoreductase-like protein
MRLGLQIPSFTWPGGPAEIGRRLGEIGRTAEASGFDSIWVMDHLFQIPLNGPVEQEMLEAYSALNYLAAHTSRARLGALVTGVTYRQPGVLIKQVTSLDVLSGGRASLGLGAAWFEREHRALGVPFPPRRERFERLEETLQIALQMWSDDNGPFRGKHFHLTATLNAPQSLSRPHPPILVGGGGEKKTLRLVARYADACNLFPDLSSVRRKLDILRQHCAAEGRDYDQIEKTVLFVFDVGPRGERASQLAEQLGAYAALGVQTAIGSVIGVERLEPLEIVGRDVLPQVSGL